MFYDDRVLREVSSIYDFPNLEDIYESLVAALSEAAAIVSHEVPGASLNIEPISIGSFVSHTNSSNSCTLDFLITSSNLAIIDNDVAFTKLKSKRQKEQLLTTGRLRHDLMQVLAGYFTSATKFYMMPNCLFIESIFELGFNINIFLGVEKHGVVFTLDAVNNRVVRFNYNKYYELIEKKNDETLGQYKRIINMTVNLLSNCEAPMSNYAIESLLYNVPNELYKGSYSDMIIKVINYLNIVDFRTFKSIDLEDDLVNNYFINTNYYMYKSKISRLVDSLR